MNFSVGLKVNIGFVLALIVLALCAKGSYDSVIDQKANAGQVRQTSRAMYALEALRATVKNTEAAHRAYVFSNDRAYRDRFKSAAALAVKQLADVRREITAGSGQDLDRLERLVTERLAELDRAVPRSDPDRKGSSAGDGEALAGDIDGLIDRLLGGEYEAMARLEKEAEGRTDRAVNIILGSGVLSLIIVGLSVVLINRDIRARQAAEEELQNARAHLEVRVRERTAELARANDDLRRENAERQKAERELQKARDELELRVRERTAELARANDDLRQEIRERALAERALRETTTLQRAILDSANYAIVSTDPDGVIRTFNAAAQRWLGYTADEVVGRHAPVLFHDPDELASRGRALGAELDLPIEPGFEVLVTRARLGQPDENEWTYVRKDDTRFPVLLSVTALHDELEEVSGFLVIGSDITERKRAEEELRRAKEAAEAANRTKSEFLANMSHELRTPLNSIIGFTNLLLKNRAGNLRDQDLAFLQRVLDNGKHLLGLINQILDLAKVEAGRIDLEPGPVALDQLVRDTVAQLEGQVRDKELRLVTDLPPALPIIRADAGKLKQVLINLIGNALKFTDQGSVTVRVLTGPGGRPAALEVEDTGVGIPPDKLESIFEAFQQVDVSPTRRYGGTGLGLSIVRSLCRLMGYRIEVRSQLGKGSCFRVVLGEVPPGPPVPEAAPRRDAAAPLALPGPHAPLDAAQLRGRQVLIIDDDSDSRILLTQYVEDCGCRVAAVGSGEEGLHLAKEFRPELIILDLMMPGMDGWEVLKALKAHPTLNRVPVVVVSIVAGENRGSILGAVDVLDKPVSREALAEILRRNLGARPGKALIVDDDADARLLAGRYLRDEGFEVREAADGRDALEQLRDFEADLVILDLMMPGMDGMTFLQALRRDPRHLHLPVVVVTALDLTPQEVRRLRSDASAVLPKGGDLAEGLKRVVREVLQPQCSGAPLSAGGE